VTIVTFDSPSFLEQFEAVLFQDAVKKMLKDAVAARDPQGLRTETKDCA